MAVERAAALTSEEARQQAQAEGLTLRVAENSTGFFGVAHRPGKPKPYQVQVTRGGKVLHLGMFVTAEEAALCIARAPEGQLQAVATAAVAAAAERAVALHRAAEQALAALGKGKKRCR